MPAYAVPMTEDRRGLSGRLSRRRLLGLGAATVATGVASTVLPASPSPAADLRTLRQATGVAVLQPPIRPRVDWAGELGVKGEIVPEDDVRFLLVHHTASSNSYSPDDVVGQIRGFYEFHTGPEKGWPDVAYNFFVDRYGSIWEGREGSLAGPVRGDATGGSQGFGLLCSLIGNFHEEPMTPEQEQGLIQLLAWLADSYAIDTTPTATTSFVSRGSNRWPAGTEVTASTISGHRDMSTTTCPGDFVYPLLADQVPTQVSQLRLASAADPNTTESPTTEPSTTASSTAAPPTTESSASQTDSAPTTLTSTSDPSLSSTGAATELAGTVPADGTSGRTLPAAIIGAGAAVVAAGGAIIARIRGNPGD